MGPWRHRSTSGAPMRRCEGAMCSGPRAPLVRGTVAFTPDDVAAQVLGFPSGKLDRFVARDAGSAAVTPSAPRWARPVPSDEPTWCLAVRGSTCPARSAMAVSRSSPSTRKPRRLDHLEQWRALLHVAHDRVREPARGRRQRRRPVPVTCDA